MLLFDVTVKMTERVTDRTSGRKYFCTLFSVGLGQVSAQIQNIQQLYYRYHRPWTSRRRGCDGNDGGGSGGWEAAAEDENRGGHGGRGLHWCAAEAPPRPPTPIPIFLDFQLDDEAQQELPDGTAELEAMLKAEYDREMAILQQYHDKGYPDGGRGWGRWWREQLMNKG